MGSVLGLLRLATAILLFCTIAVPPFELPGSMSIGFGTAAWADDGDNDDDDDDDDGFGGGMFGAASGARVSGLSVPVPADAGDVDHDRAADRRLDPGSALYLQSVLKALNADDRLVAVRTGGWSRLYRSYAVRDHLLALSMDPLAIRELEAAGFQLIDNTPLGTLGMVASRFSLPAGRDIEFWLRLARSRVPGALIEPNYIYQYAASAAGEICGDGECLGHRLIGWEEVAESCGAGIRIGMTDTGVDRDHPALRDRVVRTRVFDPFGAGSAPDHGTAVAGLLIGNAESGFPGMLPGAELFAADVFHTNDAGDSYSTLLSLIQGLDWLVGEGVPVINVSMTGPPNALLEEAVRRMNERGVVVVAAAGNGGPAAPPAYPAAYGDVISVTAIDRDLRPYSMANRGPYISFSSPGVQIWSAATAGAGRRRTGTSFAAAHVSAIIADAIRRGESTDIDDALQALRMTARDLGAPGKDPVFGWGLIQGKPACRD